MRVWLWMCIILFFLKHVVISGFNKGYTNIFLYNKLSQLCLHVFCSTLPALQMSHNWINIGDSALSQLRHMANFPKKWQTWSVIINCTLGPGLSLGPRYFTVYCLAPPRASPRPHWSTDPPRLICHLSSSLDGHCVLQGWHLAAICAFRYLADSLIKMSAAHSAIRLYFIITKQVNCASQSKPRAGITNA